MNHTRHWLVAASLLVLCARSASATPITFQLDGATIVGGAFATSQTYVPGFPIVGSGDIDFAAGTGTLTLPDYSIFIDILLNGADVRLDLTNWSQTITAIDGAGNITSTGGGSTSCTILGGLGSLVCPTVPPTVAGWPPPNGNSLPSSAVLDSVLRTITVTDNSNATAGTVTQFFSYAPVPEPGAGLLLTAGLVLMARRRA